MFMVFPFTHPVADLEDQVELVRHAVVLDGEEHGVEDDTEHDEEVEHSVVDNNVK